MGRVYQKYADAIFEAASHRLGRWIAAPQVLRGFDDEPESEPVASQPPPAAYATEAASKSSYPPSTTSSSTSATETNSALDRSVRALRSITNIF